MNQIKKQINSFAAALNGIVKSMRQEFHLRLHGLAMVIVLFLGFYKQVSNTEWMFLIICMSSVVALEIVNSAIERLSDRVTTKSDPLIKLAKDMAAGAVLVASISSVVIGCIIFIPKFINA